MLFEAFHMCALIAHYGDKPSPGIVISEALQVWEQHAKRREKVCCYSPTGFSTNLSS